MSTVYTINKGINKPIEFKGLKAQYIGYLAGGVIGLLVLFAILYISGVNMFLALGITLVLGIGLFIGVHRMSDKFGQHGLTKKMARRAIPDYITTRSRKTFLQL